MRTLIMSPTRNLHPGAGGRPHRAGRTANGLSGSNGVAGTGNAGRLVTAHRWLLPVEEEENRLMEILRHTAVCELVPATGPAAEAMRLGYGYQDGLLYCRAEPDGWQLSVVRLNPEVRFTIAPEPGAAAAPRPLLSPDHRVVGTGWARVVEDADAKREALDVIMAHYGRPGPLLYHDDALRRNAVIRVAVHQWRLEPAPPCDPAAGTPDSIGGPS